MNTQWHQAHRLGTHASKAARVAWHAAHEDACDCRPSPRGLAPAIRDYKKNSD
jgi:hypothetical protein